MAAKIEINGQTVVNGGKVRKPMTFVEASCLAVMDDNAGYLFSKHPEMNVITITRE